MCVFRPPSIKRRPEGESWDKAKFAWCVRMNDVDGNP
jgi:hypothetical protein